MGYIGVYGGMSQGTPANQNHVNGRVDGPQCGSKNKKQESDHMKMTKGDYAVKRRGTVIADWRKLKIYEV